MVILYSDLFVFTLVPIIMQSVASIYLWRFRRFIGRNMASVFAGQNAILLIYDVLISYAVYTTPLTQQQQDRSIDPMGLFIAFIMPTVMAVLMFILQRRIAKTVMSISKK